MSRTVDNIKKEKENGSGVIYPAVIGSWLMVFVSIIPYGMVFMAVGLGDGPAKISKFEAIFCGIIPAAIILVCLPVMLIRPVNIPFMAIPFGICVYEIVKLISWL